MKALILLIFLSNIFLLNLYSDDKLEIGIEEKLDHHISDDLQFVNSKGDTINLKESINKPTVLALVYFNCPGVCGPLLNGLQDLINRSKLIPGDDYDIISLSFDHHEDYKLARKWKNEYIAGLDKEIDRDGWKFLTSDSINISRLTDELGFRYQIQIVDSSLERVDYLHAATLIVLTPKGKVARYLRGTDFSPFNLKMSVIEANKENSQPTIAKVLLLCFKYDAEGKTYTLDLLFVAGMIITSILAIFFIWLVISGKNKSKERLKNVN